MTANPLPAGIAPAVRLLTAAEFHGLDCAFALATGGQPCPPRDGDEEEWRLLNMRQAA